MLFSPRFATLMPLFSRYADDAVCRHFAADADTLPP